MPQHYNESENLKKMVTVMTIQYLILIPMIFLAVAKVLLQGMISRTYLKNTTDSVLYNLIVFSGMSVIYFLICGFRLPSLHILPYGALYGLLLAGFQIFFTLALQRGPVSHTTLIINFNIAFSICFGVFYCGETMRITNIIGLICMFLSLLLTVDFKQAKQHKFDILWLILSLLATTCNGMSSIVLKLQKMTYPAEDMGMLLTAYVSAAIALGIAVRFLVRVRKQPKTVLLHPARVSMMLCSSLIMGLHLILFSKGAGMIPAVVFFPVANIAPATVISLFGIFVFKDSLTRQQIFSLVFGIAATLLLCF